MLLKLENKDEVDVNAKCELGENNDCYNYTEIEVVDIIQFIFQLIFSCFFLLILMFKIYFLFVKIQFFI